MRATDTTQPISALTSQYTGLYPYQPAFRIAANGLSAPPRPLQSGATNVMPFTQPDRVKRRTPPAQFVRLAKQVRHQKSIAIFSPSAPDTTERQLCVALTDPWQPDTVNIHYTDHIDFPVSHHNWLRARYGLTKTEIRLLHLVSNGCSPSDIAERSQKSLATIRTQFRSLYTKTEFADLGRLQLFAQLLCHLPADQVDTWVLQPDQTLNAQAAYLGHILAQSKLLSGAELDIATALLSNHTPADIAQERERSVHTVRTQIKNILSKLNLTSVFELRHVINCIGAALARG